MFDKNDPLINLMRYIIFLSMLMISLCFITLLISSIQGWLKNNLSLIMFVILGFIVCGLCLGVYVFKKEYNRITNEDFDRVKRLLSQYLHENYFTGQNDSFALVEEEKGLTRKDFLKRCFNSYHVDLKVFVPDGELLCTVKVYKKGIRVKNIERLSHMNYRKEFTK
ncbi:hypothetical protein [Bacillus cereus group sp. BfR-BA-01328]|uniref:hypothetical protein n=1 Tax=Bacillus cereus group sp. BfR-BA-01328 TaxID=2920304 RepID=UPI001F55EE49